MSGRDAVEQGSRASTDPAAIEVKAGAGTPWDLDDIKRYEDLGITGVNVAMPTRAGTSAQWTAPSTPYTTRSCRKCRDWSMPATPVGSPRGR